MIRVFPFILFLFLACKEDTSSKVKLASYNGEDLYLSDISHKIPSLSEEDSLRYVNQLVEEWLRETIILGDAKKKVDVSKIKPFVQSYENELILGEYEKTLINEKLNTNVTQADILVFLENNELNFTGKDEYYQLRFGKFKSTISNLESVDALWEEKLWDSLTMYCSKFAEICQLDEKWMSLTELKQFLPQELLKPNVLKEEQYLQRSKDQFEYFLYLTDKKKESSTMNESVKAKIKNLILLERSNNILKEHKKELYQKELDDQKFKSYLN